MGTSHEVRVGDARDLSVERVDLVVTSPPYPMVEMWDDTFSAQDPAIGTALDDGEGDRAFRLMHDVLDGVWARLADVVREGGIVAVNVGDATRSMGEFQQYPNAAEITRRMRAHGFSTLPDILWRKPTNAQNKFMGSGMLPTNAYPTLEHEHILLFRNGGPREFPPSDETRYESAYFWDERNTWFSDAWEIRGRRQTLADGGRDRSGAFPFELPYRLVSMFSVYDDTVLDPFWGTGTTSLAALVAGRNSVGYERDGSLLSAFERAVTDAPALSTGVVSDRLDSQRAFAADHPTDYEADHYDFGVKTRRERRIRLYEVADVARDGRTWHAAYDPV
ncbi:DNA-methyltransferase [Halosegnis rubeus]|uniref:Type II methyltransferase n=1 Tax=Halosegnis rubeus TaxID=2212850 RepID=A0A5N5UIG5_9EURY|nr:site-specific DNA-methyltransferase [Halosegnis rubeus]KAB7518557.1 site-specific DNA-methyltransferase [Halosegnis rubeus]